MPIEFCPGYPGAFAALVASYPDDTVYPRSDFRVEWGPIFHRGRLDGSARVLVVGLDPAQHENVLRRILVGEAGQRVQGFLSKLGIERSYVMMNTFLYSAYDTHAAGTHLTDAALDTYRQSWFNALLVNTSVTAVVALGGDADRAFKMWKASAPPAAVAKLTYVKIKHPTADSYAGTTTAALLTDWNAGLTQLSGKIVADAPRPIAPYGNAFAPGDLIEIPAFDLPPGVQPWMRALDAWAFRPEQPGAPPVTAAEKAAARRYKRCHIEIAVPDSEVP